MRDTSSQQTCSYRSNPLCLCWVSAATALCIHLSSGLLLLLCPFAEFWGEGRWSGADLRARPRSVRRGGQDEARAQWPDHGCEGEWRADQRTPDFCISRTLRALTLKVFDTQSKESLRSYSDELKHCIRNTASFQSVCFHTTKRWTLMQQNHRYRLFYFTRA